MGGEITNKSRQAKLSAGGRMDRQLHSLLYLPILLFQCHVLLLQTFVLNLSGVFTNLSFIQEDRCLEKKKKIQS